MKLNARGMGGLLHHFETFFIGIDGKETILVSGGNSGSHVIQLFVIIWGNFLFEKINKFLVVSKMFSMSG